MAPKTRRQAQAARTRSIAKKRAQPLKPAPERQPRTRDSRRRQLIDAAQRRKPAVNSYRFLQQPMERQAAQHAAENFPTRLSSPRRWDQLTRER